MTPRLRTYLIAAFGVMLLSGCLRGPIVWQRMTFNQPLSAMDVSFIEDGKTSLPEVVEKLGAPNQMVRSGEGVVVRYHFTDGKNFRVNFGWGFRFLIPFFAPDMIQEGGGVGTDVFQVTCNEHWVVQDHAFAFHSQSSEFRLWPFKD